MALATSVLVTVLLLLPELSGLVVFEHCHKGNCAAHVPAAYDLSFFRLSLIASAATGFLVLLILLIQQAFNMSQKLKALNRLANKNELTQSIQNYQIVESDDIFAWCAGLIRPKIFVSRGMLNSVTDEQLELVLAHENCHMQQRDNLRKFAVHCMTLLWLPAQRQQLRKDFSLIIEHYSETLVKRQYSSTQDQLIKTKPARNLVYLAWLSIQLAIWVTVFSSAAHFLVEIGK
jgi:hypothetical protein